MMAKITLSFDNGPDPVVTPQVLDILARHGIRATFFVVGKNLETAEGQALIARAHREGHRIGNHTYSHTLPLGKVVDGAEAVAEIHKTRELIGDLAGPHPIFRPFGEGGILDRRVLCPAAVDYLCDNGFSCITWTSVPRDWENPTGWVETAMRQITEQDETLLVLHDIPTGAMNHLEDFIVRARAAGATFRQDFPISCVLIRDGKPTPLLDNYVSLTPFAA
jgi:peptidoglycan/xylan/chitin deacetylase (PgdA/CDA1 family)